MTSYKELMVWARSVQLAKLVYTYTKRFPDSEKWGLTSQMRRCSVSVPSNLAEGYHRSSKEFLRYMDISLGSLAELETQVIIAKEFYDFPEVVEINEVIEETGKMLHGLYSSIEKRVNSTSP